MLGGFLSLLAVSTVGLRLLLVGSIDSCIHMVFKLISVNGHYLVH